MRRADTLRRAALVLTASGLSSAPAFARPNTHAPAISTWDARASSVMLGYGSSLGGAGEFTRLSYSANFSSTSGLLSAQFGVHYLSYRDHDDSVLARGVSAGGVALFNFPLAERFGNGVPRSSFDFYVGGVPTALISGQLNFISVPLVIGVGVPVSPTPWLSIEPWAELSPGLNFDTRIEAVSTATAIQSAMDGTLTRAEVEDLVEEGLKITQETTLGKRAGVSLTAHLGERVDLGLSLALGAGHTGSASLGAGLVVRWDAMVPGVRRATEPVAEDTELERPVPPVCMAWQTGLRRCVATPPRSTPAAPAQRAPGSRVRPPAVAPQRTRAGARRVAPVRAPSPAPLPQPAAP
ncbi:MAG: hypothetical protein ABI895_35260, partial [Deltaproteobacteria bacterium]